MDAGIWNQGYQLDNYAGASATATTNEDDDLIFTPSLSQSKQAKMQREIFAVIDKNLPKKERDAEIAKIKKKYNK